MLLLEESPAPRGRRNGDDVGQSKTLSESGANMPDKRPMLRGYGAVPVVLMALVVVGAAVFVVSEEARHQVIMSFVRQQESYTVLYFSAHRPIQVGPVQESAEIVGDGVGSGQSAVKVFFTIVNQAGQTIAYPYEVRVVDAAGAVIGRAEGTTEVPDGSSVPATVNVDIPADQQWSAVEVDLLDRGEHIRFLRKE